MLNPNEKKEIQIALDMDGVLTDFAGATLQEMKQRPHLRHLVNQDTYRNLTKPDFEECFSREFQEEITMITRQSGFFRNLSPLPGALEALEHLVYFGIKPWILTAPFKNKPTEGQMEKSAWIGEHIYPRVGVSNISGVLFTNNKHKIGLDYVVEDRPYKFYPLQLAGKLPWTLITLAQPWNQDDPNPIRISWTEDNTHQILRPGKHYIEVFKNLGVIC